VPDRGHSAKAGFNHFGPAGPHTPHTRTQADRASAPAPAGAAPRAAPPEEEEKERRRRRGGGQELGSALADAPACGEGGTR